VLFWDIRQRVVATSRRKPEITVKRNSPLYSVRIYQNTRFTSTSCGEEIVALYQGLNIFIENLMQMGFHGIYLKEDANGKIKAVTWSSYWRLSGNSNTK